MLDTTSHIDHCPKCDTDLTPYKHVAAMPSFCLQCKFPLMLIAGKYRLQKVIGQGAVGTVYLSRHIRLQNSAERVVKVIKKELLDNTNTVQRFFREVQITADLSERNEHIIRIYDDFGEIPHLGYFYVMEYIRGVSMRTYIQQQDKLPSLSWCLDVIRQLCLALHAAHEAGVIHRDLKPDNLMLTEKGLSSTYLKVLDWGIAKPTSIVDENLTQGLVGTPHYMAPEQAMNQTISPATDMYAVGVILYELLAGINPFVAATGKRGQSHESMIDLIKAHLYETPPSIQQVMPQRKDITPEIEQVIFTALNKKPEDRYHTAFEFYEAFQQAVACAGVECSSLPSGSFQAAQMGRSSFAASNSSEYPSPHQGQLSHASSASSSPAQQLAKENNSSYQTTMDAQQQRPTASTTKKRSPLFVILLSLIVLGLGSFAGMLFFHHQPQTTTKQRPATTKRQPATTKQRPANTKRYNPIPTRKMTQQTTSAQPKQQVILTKPKQATKRKQPTPFKPVRRQKQRRQTTRRSPCPKGSWVPIYVKPSLARKAELIAEPGKLIRINNRLLCVTKKTKRVSIIQEGFSPCIFDVPRRRKKLRIKLQTAGEMGLSGQCLRR